MRRRSVEQVCYASLALWGCKETRLARIEAMVERLPQAEFGRGRQVDKLRLQDCCEAISSDSAEA